MLSGGDKMKHLIIIFLCLSGTIAQYNYNEVLEKSILFYEAQRSGKLPPNNRVHWRRDSAMNDRGQNGEDLTGGWYDAGDHVKFGFPMAWCTTTILWGIIDFEQGYKAAGQYDIALDSVKWTLDYFLKCSVGNTDFYGQVGDGHKDHAYWGRPEDMNMERPAWKITAGAPGSDLAAETAAAMAAGSIAFRNKDGGYAETLLNKARSLYDFAYNHRGKYSDSIQNAQSFYGSSGFNDELAWGALWLYRATNDAQYLSKASEFYDGGVPWSYSWDSKNPGVQLMFYKLTQQGQYKSAVEGFLNSWYPGGGITYTPKGLAWRDKWGSLRYSANSAFIAMMAADAGIQTDQARNWALGQVGYMLGSTGRSFVVGFGNNPPQRPHHRGASCNWPPARCDWNDKNKPDPNPQVLYGALVGGPDQWDNYVDDRNDYVKNEVATDYNAGFQGAIAGIIAAQNGGGQPTPPACL